MNKYRCLRYNIDDNSNITDYNILIRSVITSKSTYHFHGKRIMFKNFSMTSTGNFIKGVPHLLYNPYLYYHGIVWTFLYGVSIWKDIKNY